MTTITTIKCDGCATVIEGDPKQTGSGWRAVRIDIGAYTTDDLAMLRDGRGVHYDYCPSCYLEWREMLALWSPRKGQPRRPARPSLPL